MSDVKCPKCEHRFRVPQTDDQLLFEEDVDWELAKRALSPFRRRPTMPTNPTADRIRDAIRKNSPVVSVTVSAKRVTYAVSTTTGYPRPITDTDIIGRNA